MVRYYDNGEFSYGRSRNSELRLTCGSSHAITKAQRVISRSNLQPEYDQYGRCTAEYTVLTATVVCP